MNWQKWVLVALIIMSGLASISIIGKPRAPLTNGVCLLALLIDAAMCLLVVAA